jgi:hypothetical protein
MAPKKSKDAEPAPEPKRIDRVPQEPGRPDYEETLPVVHSVGAVRHGSRWVVVAIETQGDKVIAREIASPTPEVPGVAISTFKLTVLKKLRGLF